jgi:long-chain fatty acid transport protein
MRRSAILAGAVTVVWAGAALAQVPTGFQNIVLRNSFNPSGAGARGLGMGGAFIAVADDGTAASFNPAGLSQLRRSELALVGFGDRLESSFSLDGMPSGDSITTDHGVLDFAGLAVPFDVAGKNLTVQFSYQRSVDLFGEGRAALLGAFELRDLGFDEDGIAAFVADVNPKQTGAFHTASLSTAYEVTQRLSLGATLNYWIADWNASGTGSFSITAPALGIPLTEVERNRFSQDQDFRAFNMNFGFLLKYPWLSIGGVMRLPFGAEYHLHETRVTEDLLDGSSTPTDNSMRTTLHWPRSAGIGIAIRPVKRLTLAGDYTATQWSRTYLESVPGGVLGSDEQLDAEGNPVESFVDRNFFDLLPASQTRTVNTHAFRAGAEYLIVTPSLVIPLRAGLYRDKSPVPQIDQGGRRIEGYTFGLGLNFDRVVFDVAYEHRKSEGAVGLLTGLFEGLQPPREKVKEQRIVASVIYRFGGSGSEDPLKRAFRSLFAGSKED